MARLILIFCWLAVIISCDRSGPIKIQANTSCEVLKVNKVAFDHLFRNEFAKSLSDSMVKAMYNRYGPRKVLKEGILGDSIFFRELRITPYVLANPTGDPSTFDLIYFVSDETCTRFYDSTFQHSADPIIEGVRFSTHPEEVVCYIYSNHKLGVDSTFL